MLTSNCKSNIDLIIDKFIFNGKIGGTYIECGANDGITDSISYYFEKNYHWKGILIEPQHELMEKCKRNRSAVNKFIEKGLGDKNIKLEMTIDVNNLDNGSFDLSEEHINELKRLGFGKEFRKEVIDVISYPTLINRNKIKHIDLAIFDVEGYENRILRSMMKSEVLPDVLVVEYDWSSLQELIDIVEPKYMIYDKFKHDIIFRKI